MNRKQLVLLILTAPLVVVLALVAANLVNDDEPDRGGSSVVQNAEPDAAVDYDYLIPAGTGERLDAGEPVEIVPAELEVRVGETIRIVNEDSRGHIVGVFYVAAGETLTQTFASEGTLTGDCSVHPSGTFTLVIRA